MLGLSLTPGIASASPDSGFYGWAACGILFLALIIALKAWFHDRSKGRARCRRCWYPLPKDELRACPECGTEPRTKNDLYRTRRSKRWGIVALLLVMLSCSVWYWPHVQYRRSVLGEPFIRAVVPTTYMIWALPYTDQGEWISLYHRVSGRPPSGGLFGTPASTLPASISPILDLSPDPIDIGYEEIDPNYTYQPNTLFFSGPHIPEQMVWNWQGRYLLDRLWGVAGDNERAMPDRLGAFYLYTGYCGYTRLEHFERVLPLLRGEQGDAFLEANYLSPHWGVSGLNPDLVIEQLAALLLGGSYELIDNLNVLEGLALTGRPAIETIEKLWASDDANLQERGTDFMTVFAEVVEYARGRTIGLDRDQLDVNRIIELLNLWCSLDESSLLKLYQYDWIDSFGSVSPYADYQELDSDGNKVWQETPVEPDAFFYAFSEAFMEWIVKKSNSDQADVEGLVRLLHSYLGTGCLALDYARCEPLLDAFEKLLTSKHSDIRQIGYELYGLYVYDAISDQPKYVYSKTELRSLRQRLVMLAEREKAGTTYGETEATSLIYQLDAWRSDQADK
ncbi:MAG: hypothetical protein KTR15_15965 [Phycisphaeraceae bacterium]|nr:hypothetical protein [Phycisphaeraceae bacterium]